MISEAGHSYSSLFPTSWYLLRATPIQMNKRTIRLLPNIQRWSSELFDNIGRIYLSTSRRTGKSFLCSQENDNHSEIQRQTQTDLNSTEENVFNENWNMIDQESLQTAQQIITVFQFFETFLLIGANWFFHWQKLKKSKKYRRSYLRNKCQKKQ